MHLNENKSKSHQHSMIIHTLKHSVQKRSKVILYFLENCTHYEENLPYRMILQRRLYSLLPSRWRQTQLYLHACTRSKELFNTSN